MNAASPGSTRPLVLEIARGSDPTPTPTQGGRVHGNIPGGVEYASLVEVINVYCVLTIKQKQVFPFHKTGKKVSVVCFPLFAYV